MSDNTMTSNLEYHSYASLIVNMGSELTRWDGEDQGRDMVEYFSRPNLQLAEKARNYLDGIQKNAAKIYKGKVEDNKADSHLYNPASFISFGANTDNLSILTIDDFDFGVDVSANLDVPVKQINMAFCPTLESIVLDDTKHKYFCELSEICGGESTLSANGLQIQPYLSDRPLAVVTYYRFSGLATIGPGLLFFESILRAMANTTHDVLKDLKPVDGLFTQSDIDNFRCTFLDTQGGADLATIMLSSNYSVTAIVLMHLHRLTFSDVYNQANNDGINLVKAVEEFNIHSSISEITCSNNDDEVADDVSDFSNLLGENHIFYSSHSTANITHEAFFKETSDPSTLKYNGVVSADPLFSLSPGHIWPDETIIHEINQNKLSDHITPIKSNEAYLWALLGKFDVSEKSIFSPKQMNTVPLYRLIDRIKNIRGWHKSNPLFSGHWPIRNLATELFVPVSDFSQMNNNDKDNQNHVGLRLLLTKLRKYYFQDSQATEDENNDLHGRMPINKLKKAIRELRIPAPLSSSIVGLFVDYARSLADPNLFDNVLDLHDFFIAFYRVLTREMSLMLKNKFMKGYDSHMYLEEYARYSFMDDRNIRELESVVVLLESAMHHRLNTTFTNNEWWRAPTDFRGEVNKLVHAADVPMKCGLSVLRRLLKGEMCVDGETKIGFYSKSNSMSDEAAGILKDENTQEVRFRVGGTSRLSNCSKVTTRRFGIGHSEVNFLAEVGLNINFLLRPASLNAHLHESGHMVNDLLKTRSDDLMHNNWCPRFELQLKDCGKINCFRKYNEDINHQDFNGSDKITTSLVRRERYDEIFADMFAYGMVFADYTHMDPQSMPINNNPVADYDGMRTFMRYFFAMYFLDPISFSGDERWGLVHFAEIASRGFLACYPFSQPQKSDGSGFLFLVDDYELTDKDIKKIIDDFTIYIDDAGHFFYGTKLYWDVEENKKEVVKHFENMIRFSYKVICCIFHHVDRILKGEFYDYKTICVGASIGTNPAPEDHWKIVDDLYRAYVEGKPIVRFLYNDPRKNTMYSDKENGNCKYRMLDAEKRTHLDAFFVVRHILRFHIHEIFGKMDVSKEIFHLRNIESHKDINKQLIDKFDCGLFSVDFQKRKSYIKSRISMIKTLWDISTNIRGRTFERILRPYKRVN